MKKNTWKYWGVSEIGPFHQEAGLPNQDYWMAHSYKWGDVIVVSDGVGSKTHSHIGSRAACLAVIEAAKTYNSYPDAELNEILKLIHSYWIIKIAPLRANECSATCLFVIRQKEKSLLAQLGDGMIAVLGNSLDETIIITDDKQDSFSNVTDCFGGEFKAKQWQTHSVMTDQYNGFILCTDGISDDISPEKRNEFSFDLLNEYKSYSHKKLKKDLIGHLKNWPVKGHTDDKTIACLYKTGEDFTE